MEPTTYYLSSMESVSFAETRECQFIKVLSFDTGKQCVLAWVDPPVIGQPYGLGGKDLDLLLLASRHEGELLHPVSNFPCFVFICRPLVDSLAERDQIRKEDLAIIGRGEIYRTRHDADRHNFD